MALPGMPEPNVSSQPDASTKGLRGSPDPSEQIELSRVRGLEARLQQVKTDAEEALDTSREEGLKVLHAKSDRNAQLQAEVEELRDREKTLIEENAALRARVAARLEAGAMALVLDREKMRVLRGLDDQPVSLQTERHAPPMLFKEQAPNSSAVIAGLYKKIAVSRKITDNRLQEMTADLQKYYLKEDQRAMALNAERAKLQKVVAELEGLKAALQAALRNGELVTRMHTASGEAMSSYRRASPITQGAVATGWASPGDIIPHYTGDHAPEQLAAEGDHEEAQPSLPPRWQDRFLEPRSRSEPPPPRRPSWRPFEKGPPPTQLGPPADPELETQGAYAPPGGQRGQLGHRVQAELQEPPAGWLEQSLRQA